VGSNGDRLFGDLGTQIDLGIVGFLDWEQDIWDLGVDWDLDTSFALLSFCLGTHTINTPHHNPSSSIHQ